MNDLHVLKRTRRWEIGSEIRLAPTTSRLMLPPLSRKALCMKLIRRVTNITYQLVAPLRELKLRASLVKTFTFDDRKEFAEHQPIYVKLKSTVYLAGFFTSWKGVQTKTLMAY